MPMESKNHSPLALPFDEALQPSRFLTQMTLAAENQVRHQLAEHGNRAFGLALVGAKFVVDSGTMQVVFEGGIPAGAKLMRSAKKALPVLVDGRTNKIIKLGRVASKGRVAASIAANAALVIVEAAHMISGYDNAKRLKKVERSVDALVHAHESELKSELESVYRYSKELLHGDIEALSENDRDKLHGQCQVLFKLRAQWRDAFRFRLNHIQKAEPGWLDRVLWWRKEQAQRKSRQDKAAESLSALESVQLMHFSLMLQMTLAGSAGKMEQFIMLTLHDECCSWTSLMDFARTRSREIGLDSDGAEFNEFLGAMEELVEFWSHDRWGHAKSEAPDLPADKHDGKARSADQESVKELRPP